MTNFNPQLSDSDLELLSAYLDQQLGAAERGVLEQRLEREPALRGALDEMRATVALLRELPPARPPRSFTLDPQAVAPRRGWSFPWAQFGSAFVAVALLLVFGFALTRSYQSTGSTASAPAQQDAAAMTSAPAEAPMMAAAEPTTTAAMPAAGAALAAPTTAPAAADAQSAESSAAEPTQPELALDATTAPAARQAETPATASEPYQDGNPAGNEALPGSAAGGSAAETPAPAGTPVFSATLAATAVGSPPDAAPAPAESTTSSGGIGWVVFGALALLVALGAWWATRRRK